MLQVIDKCVGCKNITEGNTCMIYVSPIGRWSIGGCGMASHIKKEAEVKAKMVNPIKASKRGSR